MFTGTVTAIGTIREASQDGDLRIVVTCPFDPATIAIGASIACSGVCLTVTAKGGAPGDAWFAASVSDETRACTVPGRWEEGTCLNLEPALKLGEELGGHIVTGQVDAVGQVKSVVLSGGSRHLVICAPAQLAPHIAAKGSITIDGISFTVHEVKDQADGSCHFTINIIPHTAQVTTMRTLHAGDSVNLEIDVLARYIQRMQSLRG